MLNTTIPKKDKKEYSRSIQEILNACFNDLPDEEKYKPIKQIP